jgi:hypothetical protein
MMPAKVETPRSGLTAKRFLKTSAVSMAVQVVLIGSGVVLGAPEIWSVVFAKVASWSWWGVALLRNR